jgi:DNA-directed RNA polymerase I and III subunit RPAC2
MNPVRCAISLDDPADLSSGSFLFDGETHTMGNALRQAISPNPAVQFCGYSVPHPAETKMRIRIQANPGANIVDLLNQGLDDFGQWCGNLEASFDAAFAAFGPE